MSDFDDAINYVLANEGGLEENRADPGGITNRGISLRFLKSISPETLKSYGIFDAEIDANTIRNLSLDSTKAVYKGEFWSRASFSQIMNQDVANFTFDMAVNMGIAPAIKCLQRACWAVFLKMDCVLDDGLLGNITLDWVNRAGSNLSAALRSERGGSYRLIACKYPTEQEFLEGWLDRAYTK